MGALGNSVAEPPAARAGTQAPGRHIPALDGLRGAAVAAVLVFHAGYLEGGYLGVDLFFVLSGFLITGLLVTEVGGSGTVRLSTFWARRARRLLPALFAMLLVIGVWGLRARVAPSDGALGKEMLAALGYYSNWEQLFGGGGYWAQFAGPRVLEHLWSLAIEEQFYVVWPLVVWGCARLAGKHRRGGRRFRRILLSVITTGILTSVALSQWLFSTRGAERVYLGTDTRVLAILFGAALAVLSRGGRAVVSAAMTRFLDAIGFLAALGLGLAWVTLTGTSTALYRGGLIACSFAGALVIAAAALAPNGIISRLLSLQPFRALGTISYGLYLWHWPIFIWLGMRPAGFTHASRALLAIALSLAVAIASYRIIEAPIRTQRLRPRTIAAAGLMALLATSTLVFANAQRPGAHADTPTRAFNLPTITSTTTTTTTSTTSAAGTGPSSTSTTSVPPARQLRVLILGDSIAVALALEWAPKAPKYGIQLGTDTSLGCNYFSATRLRGLGKSVARSDAPPEPCQVRLASDLSTFDPDVVLITTLTNMRDEFEVDGEWLVPCTDRYETALTTELEHIRTIAKDGGTRVVFATTVPSDSSWWPEARLVREHARRVKCHNTILRAFAKQYPDTIAIADAYKWACPRDTCVERMNGVLLRPDGAHFEGPGAFAFIDWVVPHLFAEARPITS